MNQIRKLLQKPSKFWNETRKKCIEKTTEWMESKNVKFEAEKDLRLISSMTSQLSSLAISQSIPYRTLPYESIISYHNAHIFTVTE